MEISGIFWSVISGIVAFSFSFGITRGAIKENKNRLDKLEKEKDDLYKHYGDLQRDIYENSLDDAKHHKDASEDLAKMETRLRDHFDKSIEANGRRMSEDLHREISRLEKQIK